MKNNKLICSAMAALALVMFGTSAAGAAAGTGTPQGIIQPENATKYVTTTATFAKGDIIPTQIWYEDSKGFMGYLKKTTSVTTSSGITVTYAGYVTQYI